ncbi:MAG: hypothetical protein QXP94_02260 [Thermofilaceae archaeon]
MRVTRRLIAASALAVLTVAAVTAYLLLQTRAEEWRVEVTVGDCRKVFALPELEKMSTEREVRGAGVLRCVPLVDLVAECGVDLNSTLVHRLVAVGADGYSRSVEEAYLYLSKAYLCLPGEAYPDWGPVRLVVEGLSSKYWVKQLVAVNAQLGSWVLNVRVDGETKRVFTLEEIERLARDVEGIGKAVPLVEILRAIGLSEDNVSLFEFVGADGYRSVFKGGNATRAFVLLINPQDWPRYGPLRSAVVGAPRGTWVRHLVAVEVITKE